MHKYFVFLLLFFSNVLFAMERSCHEELNARRLRCRRRRRASRLIRKLSCRRISGDRPLFEFLKKGGKRGKRLLDILKEPSEDDLFDDHTVVEESMDVDQSDELLANAWSSSGQDLESGTEFQVYEEDFCGHQKVLWCSNRKLKKKFRERVENPQVVIPKKNILGQELDEDELEYVGRPIHTSFFPGEVVVYKKENQYVYAKIYRAFCLECLIVISNTGKEIFYASKKYLFKIYKCKVHPSMRVYT